MGPRSKAPRVPARERGGEPAPVDFLDRVLRAPLAFHDIRKLDFPSWYSSGRELITTHRFMLVLRGEVHYTVDGVAASIGAGHLFFVPAWVRREWHPKPRTSCQCLWCEFSAEEVEFDVSTLFLWKCRAPGVERTGLERMLKAWPGARISDAWGTSGAQDSLPRASRLRMEGELKAMLGRFWTHAVPWDAGKAPPERPSALHPALKQSLTWLNRHCLQPSALRDFYGQLSLSPNHFRLLFHEAIGCSPQDYLTRLRMRRARFLVLGGSLPFKEVAALLGFSDPLFFSRQYHHFFGVGPREDRLRSR